MVKTKFDIVDFHSHILPGADHGSSSVEISLLQLKHASARGIRRIIATPHFYPMREDVSSFLERRRSTYNALMEALPEASPEIKVGAEVMICNGIERLPGLDKLFINGTSTMLMEMPVSGFQSDFADSVYRLVSSGVKVVIAHPERYEPSAVEAVIESGAFLQCNAFVISKIKKPCRLLPWIASKSIIAIGSDIHGDDASAYSHFAKATSRFGEYINYIKNESDTIWNEAEYGLNN